MKNQSKNLRKRNIAQRPTQTQIDKAFDEGVRELIKDLYGKPKRNITCKKLLQKAHSELARVRNLLLPRYEGKLAEPNPKLIKEIEVFLYGNLALDDIPSEVYKELLKHFTAITIENNKILIRNMLARGSQFVSIADVIEAIRLRYE